MYFLYYSWDSYFRLRIEGVVEVVLFTIDNKCDIVVRKIKKKNRREMMQGFSLIFQEDEVQHAVSPYMSVPLYLSDQHGVELRFFFVRRRIFFENGLLKIYNVVSLVFNPPNTERRSRPSSARIRLSSEWPVRIPPHPSSSMEEGPGMVVWPLR